MVSGEVRATKTRAPEMAAAKVAATADVAATTTMASASPAMTATAASAESCAARCGREKQNDNSNS